MKLRLHGFFASLGVIGILAYLLLIVLMVWGWLLNIFGVIAMIDGGFTALFALRIIGIFLVPVGGILGWVL